MSGANSWLQRQRKSDLVEIAQNVGLKEYVAQPPNPDHHTLMPLTRASMIHRESVARLECPTAHTQPPRHYAPPPTNLPTDACRFATTPFIQTEC